MARTRQSPPVSRYGDDDVFSTYVASFERVWSPAHPLTD